MGIKDDKPSSVRISGNIPVLAEVDVLVLGASIYGSGGWIEAGEKLFRYQHQCGSSWSVPESFFNASITL